jgi:hypothetical protein
LNATTADNGTFILTDSPSDAMNASLEAPSPSIHIDCQAQCDDDPSEIIHAIDLDPLGGDGGMDMDMDINDEASSAVSHAG